MNRAKIKQKVFATIAEHLDVEINKITEVSTLDELGADSLDSVELVMALEEEINIDIPDEDVENLKNISEYIDYIQKKLKNSAR